MSPPSAGGLCVWNVGPCGHRHHGGLANCWCPLQHQDDSPQEEKQFQTPEEEGQTARGQYPSCIYHLILIEHQSRVIQWHQRLLSITVGLKFILFILLLQQPREPSTSHQDQAMLLADSSEDEFWWDPFGIPLSMTNGQRSCYGGSADITIAMTTASPITRGCLAMTHLIHGVWQIGVQFAQAAQWSALWSGDVDCNNLAELVWRTLTLNALVYCCSQTVDFGSSTKRAVEEWHYRNVVNM